MSDDNTQTDIPELDEKTLLLSRCKQLGISVSNNSSIELLKSRIAEKLEGSNKEDVAPPLLKDPADTPTDSTVTPTLRQYLQKKAMKLIRIRISCMDPKKRDIPGEVITVANEYMGTVRKYVPYGEATDEGYHVPMCIYNALKARKFNSIRTRTDKNNNNQIIVESSWVPEYAIEVLPPLTKEELRNLATAQAAAAGGN